MACERRPQRALLIGRTACRSAGIVVGTVWAVSLLVGSCRSDTDSAAQSATAAADEPSPSPDEGKVRPMSADQVVQAIRTKDWTVVDPPDRIGPEVAEAILPFLDDEDREARELAVHCLDRAGGERAKQGLLKALRDDYAMARAAAARFLHAHVDQPDLAALLQELESNEDEYVREQLALVVGRIGTEEAIAALGRKMEGEPDTHARHALSLAMARLGDARQVEAYTVRLRSDDVESRVGALEDFEYLAQNQFLPHIRPLLDDGRDGANVAPGGHRYFIRVCDVAVNVLDKVFESPFPFASEQVKRYSDEELAQAKAAFANSEAWRAKGEEKGAVEGDPE